MDIILVVSEELCMELLSPVDLQERLCPMNGHKLSYLVRIKMFLIILPYRILIRNIHCTEPQEPFQILIIYLDYTDQSVDHCKG